YDPPVDAQARRLYCSFTRGRFDSGGRLFGGFWELSRAVGCSLISRRSDAAALVAVISPRSDAAALVAVVARTRLPPPHSHLLCRDGISRRASVSMLVMC